MDFKTNKPILMFFGILSILVSVGIPLTVLVLSVLNYNKIKECEDQQRDMAEVKRYNIIIMSLIAVCLLFTFYNLAKSSMLSKKYGNILDAMSSN
jgi:uncharacterized membrane protein YidH (DUF202 family)